MKRDVILGAVTGALCIVFYLETLKVNNLAFAKVGADLWPQIAIGCIFVLSIVQVIVGFKAPAEAPADAGDGLLEKLFAPVVVFGTMIAFPLLVPVLGMTVSGALMVLTLLSILGPKTPLAMVLHVTITLVSVLSITFIFTRIMGIVLPGFAL